MRIAALLPHVEVFGGVRRYIELGNALIERGHSFSLFHPSGNSPDWLEFKGLARPFSALGGEAFDIGLCSEYSILPEFDKLRAERKYFYFVLAGHRREKEVARRDYYFLANSEGLARRLERKHGILCRRAPGGVNPSLFYPVSREDPGNPEPDRPVRILCYGRIYKKRKGVRLAVKAVEGLRKEFPNLRLVLFDSFVGQDRLDPRPLLKTAVPFDFHMDLPQSRMAWLYSQADVFVSAERRAGWSNTAAEAMACGVPVVCTRSGTRDFAINGRTALVVPIPLPWLLRPQIRKLLLDPELRARLSRAGREKIQEFTWGSLAERLEKIFLEARPGD